MKLSASLLLPTLCAAALALSSTLASAQVVILSDNFNRTEANLDGDSPTVGSGTWTAPNSGAPNNTPFYSVNGTSVQASSSITNAFLAFTPSTGLVYNLSVDVTVPSGEGNDWAGIGFNNSSGTNGFANTASAPWMFVRGNGGLQAFGGTGTNNNAVNLGAGTVTAGSTVNLRVQLDTTASQWVARFYYNDTLAGSYTYTSGNPTISRVLIGVNNAPATFDNLLLTQVPEPSTGALAMLSLGAVFLTRRRR